MINTVFLDLDATLLPMKTNKFAAIYFKNLFFAKIARNPIKLTKSLIKALTTLVADNSDNPNEQVLYDAFFELYNLDRQATIDAFEQFYTNKRYLRCKKTTWQSKEMIQAIDVLKQKGYTLVLATNPIFPSVATERRIEWAGVDKNMFAHITTLENSSACKPSLKYYSDILKLLGKSADQVMMVGNDKKEDLAAGELGIKTFLVTDCIYHKDFDEYTPDYSGTAVDFLNFCNNLEQII